MRQFIGSTIIAAGLAVANAPAPAAAQDTVRPGQRVASVTYGPYARLEFGQASFQPDGGYWQPPGYPRDPEITFDLDGEEKGFGALAVGFDWQNGWRADLGLVGTGSSDITGPCSGASDGTSCAVHADITAASVETRAVMASVFYSPLEAQGSNSIFQPFLVAGLGIARNEVSEWTRTNPASGRLVRTFEGDASTGLAWSLGIGASLQVTRPGEWPVILEASWRYYDFGEAQGSATPLPGNGSGSPVTPLTFDNTSQVVSIGVRIPLQRY